MTDLTLAGEVIAIGVRAVRAVRAVRSVAVRSVGAERRGEERRGEERRGEEDEKDEKEEGRVRGQDRPQCMRHFGESGLLRPKSGERDVGVI